MSLNEHQIASEILSRVDCPFCHGRLHTEHREDCPVIAETARRQQELNREIRNALWSGGQT